MKPIKLKAKPMMPWQSFTQSFYAVEKMQTLCEHFAKDCRDIKAQLELKQDFVSTTVIAVAVGHEDYMNNSYLIQCNGGNALNHSCYNVARDAYEVCAVEHMIVGTVPICYQLEITGILDFSLDIPLPEKVFSRYLTPDEILRLKQFKKRFNKEDFDVVFLQMLNSSPPMPEVCIDVQFPPAPVMMEELEDNDDEISEQEQYEDDLHFEDEIDQDEDFDTEGSPSW